MSSNSDKENLKTSLLNYLDFAGTEFKNQNNVIIALQSAVKTVDIKSPSYFQELGKQLSNVGNTAKKGKETMVLKNLKQHLLEKINEAETKESDDKFAILTCLVPLSSLKGEQSLSDLKEQGFSKVVDFIYVKYLLPTAYPKWFHNENRNLLLFGPPGTGKTMFVKAMSKDLIMGGDYLFFNIHPKDVTGPYFGETEKKIRAVFTCAKHYLNTQPSLKGVIIFIDEFEYIAGRRKESDESSKRKTGSLLPELDGIQSNSKITLVAATNLPEELDIGILRRFNDIQFVDIPTPIAKYNFIKQYLDRKFDKLNKDLFPKVSTDNKNLATVSLWTNTGLNDNLIKSLSVLYFSGSQKYQEIEKPSGNTTPIEGLESLKTKYGWTISDIKILLDKALQIRISNAIDNFENVVGYNNEFYVCNSLVNISQKQVINSLTNSQKENVIVADLNLEVLLEASHTTMPSLNEKEYEKMLKYVDTTNSF